jgi:hypothetical protein
VVTEFGANGMKFKVKEGSKIGMDFQFDACIDGAEANGVLKMEMKMKLDATFTSPDGKDIAMLMDVKSTGTHKMTDVPRK